jgi:hypothetical protein
VKKHPQANLSIVHQWVTAVRKGGLRQVVAGAIAKLARKTALLTAPAIGSRLQIEESRRVEIVDRLATASDVSHRGCHAQKDEQNRCKPMAPALSVHGSTS